MIIELVRALAPQDMGEDVCGICGYTFEKESVLTPAATEDLYDMGYACPSCLDVLTREMPKMTDRCPTIEQYVEALQRYPKPVCATDEEAEARDERGELPWDTWIWKAEEVHALNRR